MPPETATPMPETTETPDIRADVTRGLAEDLADPATCLPDSDAFRAVDMDQLNEACRNARWIPNPDAVDEALSQVLIRLVEMSPLIPGLLPPLHPSKPEFQWSTCTALFSAFGHAYWPTICEAMHQVRNDCIWSAADTYTEWKEQAEEARRSSGIGLALPAVSLRRLASAVEREKEAVPQPWHYFVAAFHLLRYLRTSPQYGFVSTFGGRSIGITVSDDATTIGSAPRVIAAITEAINLPLPGSEKSRHPIGLAAHFLLRKLSRSALLSRRPLSDLPGAVLAGPWTHYGPSADHTDRWWDHGLGLRGGYIAAGGIVRSVHTFKLAADDLLGYEWSPGAPDSETYKAFDLWRASIVPTYGQGERPTSALLRYCPQLRFVSDTHRAYVDAILLAGVLRSSTQILTYEYPMLLLLAGAPSAEQSTNNGKTGATQVLLHSQAPACPIIVASRSTASQERRSVAVSAAMHGTIGLDEWSCAVDPEHLLNRENLQTLCTGGRVTFGLVRDNGAHTLSLRTNIVANAKALKLPEDLINRAAFIFCDPLTDEQRADAAAYRSILSGAAATAVRLAAVGYVETHAEDLQVPQHASTTASGLRFAGHRHLAAVVLSKEHGTTVAAALEGVDEGYREMVAAYHQHSLEASQSGLMAELASSGNGGDIGLPHLFDMFSLGEMSRVMTAWDAAVRDLGRKAMFGAPVGALMRAAAYAQFMKDPNASLPQAVGRHLNDDEIEMLRPRALDRRMLADVLRHLPKVGMTYPLPGMLGLGGWGVQRCPDENSRHFFALVCRAPTPAV